MQSKKRNGRVITNHLECGYSKTSIEEKIEGLKGIWLLELTAKVLEEEEEERQRDTATL